MYSLEAAKRELLEILKLEGGKIHSFSESKFADLASGYCFEAAKVEKKSSPKDVAELKAKEIAKPITDSRFFDKVENLNGYLNFFLSNSFYNNVLKETQKDSYGETKDGKGKTVIVEFSSPNVGKPMHIGHIRSTILGDAIERAYEFQGFKTIGSNYLCDAGSQVGKLMLGIQLWGEENIHDEKDLLQFYVKINEKIEGDPKLVEEVKKIVKKMEDGEEVLKEQLDRVRRISLNAFEENYRNLGITFKEEVYDSQYAELGKKLALEAEKQGLAERGPDNELFAKLEEYKLPNLIILRSNNTTLYSTRDLALAEWRAKKYKFDKCIIITASEQNTHFNQVFKILELLGRKFASKLQHIGFGLIDVKGVKMSSRKGQVLFLVDVLRDAKEAALNEIKIRENVEPAIAEETAWQIGIGAIKFGVLKISPEKNISFDIEKAVQFEGDTGAYVQYAVVRCNSILNDAANNKEQKTRTFKEFNEFEKDLLKKVAKFPEVVKSAANSNKPHTICDYTIELANSFSKFYANCKVLTDDQTDRQKRLQIVSAVKTTLTNAMKILNIPMPQKM